MSLFTVIPQGPFFESNGRKQLSLSSCGWVFDPFRPVHNHSGPTHVSRRSCTSPDSEPVDGFVLSQGSVWTGWGPAIGSPGACVCVMFLGGWVEWFLQEGVRKRISRPDHWGAAEWRGRLRTPDSSSLRVPGCLRLGKCLMSASVDGCGFS